MEQELISLLNNFILESRAAREIENQQHEERMQKMEEQIQRADVQMKQNAEWIKESREQMKKLEEASAAHLAWQKEFSDRMDRRFESIDQKFEAMDRKIEAMDQKFESKFEAMDQKFKSKFDLLLKNQDLIVLKLDAVCQDVALLKRTVGRLNVPLAVSRFRHNRR